MYGDVHSDAADWCGVGHKVLAQNPVQLYSPRPCRKQSQSRVVPWLPFSMARLQTEVCHAARAGLSQSALCATLCLHRYTVVVPAVSAAVTINAGGSDTFIGTVTASQTASATPSGGMFVPLECCLLRVLQCVTRRRLCM